MRDDFPGWYGPTSADRDHLWGDKCIFVLDANTLLYPYRVPEANRVRFFDVLAAHKTNLWCPYQAGLEYQRHRLGVVEDQRKRFDEIKASLRKAEAQLSTVRRDHPSIDTQLFERKVRDAIAGLTRWVDDAQNQHPRILGESDNDDVIRDQWDELLAGQVGSKLEITEQWRKDADDRYSAKIPPGFEDAKKPEGRQYGDLIIWSELIARVKDLGQSQEPTPVLLITDDRKEDWWRMSSNRRLGPLPALVDELAAAHGQPFWMYTPAGFVEAAEHRLGWEPVAAFAERPAGDHDAPQVLVGGSALDRLTDRGPGLDVHDRGAVAQFWREQLGDSYGGVRLAGLGTDLTITTETPVDDFKKTVLLGEFRRAVPESVRLTVYFEVGG